MASADPYTAKAAQDATPQEKLQEVEAIVKEVKTGMLVSVNPDGSLHSRAMAPVSEKGLVFDFIANNQSGKFEELEANPQVNISFYGPESTNWASVSGRAKVTNDAEKIKGLWNPAIKAWFGDLKDGVHSGDYTDPRVSLIEVIPTEVRYWQRTTSKIGQAFDVAKGAVTGETAAPGHIRQISENELKLFRKQ